MTMGGCTQEDAHIFETPNSRLCWRELLATNRDGALSFYGDMVAQCIDPDGAHSAVHTVAGA